MSTSNLREAILGAATIQSYLSDIGVKCKGEGESDMISCPLHKDKSPSCSINHSKQLWNCFSCGCGGTIIDMHMRLNGLSVKETMLSLAQKYNITLDEKPHKAATYDYRNQLGKSVMRVDRIESGAKKKFRQYHMTEDGKEVNGLDGVSRVLYRLEQWYGADEINLCEGEKCVHAFERIGRIGTTNPGGSGGWLDAYSEYLSGKKVSIWPDSDEPGRKWLDCVLESLEGKVKALRVMSLPEEYNDIADMIDAKGEELGAVAVAEIEDKVGWIDRGVQIDLLSSEEAYALYEKRVNESKSVGICLGKWLPSLKKFTRPMMPGDLVTILADTGMGKTAVLTNLAYSQSPLPTIFFELELSPEAMVERFSARDLQATCLEIEKMVAAGRKLDVKGWSHVFTCPNPRVTVDDMEKIIVRSELKIGKKPALVCVDYIGLISGGVGKRYERISQIAEDMKRLARETNTVVVIASQVHRAEKFKGQQTYETDTGEVGLHDAKDSSSIEHSSQLVLGMWRTSPTDMNIKLLKQTRMPCGQTIHCKYDGDRQTISELPPNEEGWR